MKTILLLAKTHPDFIAFLCAQTQYKIVYNPDITDEEIEALLPQADGIILATRLRLDRKLIDKAQRLRWVGRLGSGLEHIDTAYLTQKKIPYFASPEGNRRAVAEHALGMLLSLLRLIHTAAEQVEMGVWEREKNRGEELATKTVGIIGYGHTGGAFAKILYGMGVSVLAYDKYKTISPMDIYAKSCTLTDIFLHADVVSLHLPLTEETRNYANRSFFNSFEKPVYFLNTSRGVLVDERALLDALQTKKIRAAALDVLVNERIAQLSVQEKKHFALLQQNPKILITPHIAGYTQESLKKMASVLKEKLQGAGIFN